MFKMLLDKQSYMTWTERLEIKSPGLFREPDGRKLRHLVTIGVGIVAVILGPTGWFLSRGPDLYIFFIGLFMSSFGIAEILPRDRTQAAGILRVFAIMCMILGGVAIVYELGTY